MKTIEELRDGCKEIIVNDPEGAPILELMFGIIQRLDKLLVKQCSCDQVA